MPTCVWRTTLRPWPAADPALPTSDECTYWTQILWGLAGAATSQGEAPILYIQFPAAPIGEIGEPGHKIRGIRRSQSPCVRMAVAIDQKNPGARIAFLQAVARIARDYNLALQLGDRTPGAVRGQWVRGLAIQASDPGEPSIRPAPVPTRGYAVSVVGPARRGSTFAVLDVLKRFDIGIVSMSVSALQEVACINLVVPAAAGGPPDGLAENGSASGYTADKGLGRLIGLATRPRDDEALALDLAVADYRVYLSGPFDLAFDAALSSEEIPFWAKWDYDLTEVPPYGVLSALAGAAALGESAGLVRYARSRSLDSRRVRGRAKVSVRSAISHQFLNIAEDQLNRMAKEIEDSARQTIAELNPALDPDSLRLKVEFRERWLGGHS
jgi:hypothetical protein